MEIIDIYKRTVRNIENALEDHNLPAAWAAQEAGMYAIIEAQTPDNFYSVRSYLKRVDRYNMAEAVHEGSSIDAYDDTGDINHSNYMEE